MYERLAHEPLFDNTKSKRPHRRNLPSERTEA